MSDARPTTDALEGRFWAKVDKCGECWEWTASIADVGYGQFWNGTTTVYSHRFAYELIVGAIPEGLTLDHLCRNRPCVNPAHLEPVTHRVNILRGTSPSALNARKTECPQGHPYDSDNTYVDAKGGRHCRKCGSAASSRYASRRAALLTPPTRKEAS